MSIKKISYLLVFVSIVFSTGCATVSDPADMSVSEIEIINIHEGSVSIQTSEGYDNLKAAIENSIIETGVFEAIVTDGADYILSAYLAELDSPAMGFSFTVKVELAWSLTRKGESKPVWEKAIRSEHTTGAGEAFAGVTRQRMATEGAIKNNIEEALTEITNLSL